MSMFTTPTSQHRAYIVAVLLCSIVPASLVFWFVGFLVGVVLLYGAMGGSQIPDYLAKRQAIQIIALLISIFVIYRYYKEAINELDGKRPINRKPLLKKPRSA